MRYSVGLWAIFCAFIFLPSPSQAASEWEGVTHEELGISQEELQKVKEKGMSRHRLMYLLEYGISPNEYFSQPWKRLGVSESQWLKEKKAGMADDDIDRSYRKQGSNNLDPVWSGILPGFYQYKTRRPTLGAALSLASIGFWSLTFLHREEGGRIHPVYPIAALSAHLVSFGDAILKTRFVDNQDAQRFSLWVSPTLDGMAALGHWSF